MKNLEFNIKNNQNNNINPSIMTQIKIAITKSDKNELAKILKENQPNLNEFTTHGQRCNILKDAITDGKKVSIIKTILDYKPIDPSFALDINELSSGCFSHTAIGLATAYNRENVVKLLLDYGADPKIANSYGSALHSAVLHTNPEITKMFLELGADPNEIIQEDYQSRNGWLMKNVAPIHIAMTSDNPLEILKLLIAYGADLNLKYNDLGVEGMDPEDMQYDEKYDRTAFELYTLGGTDKTKVEEFNKAVQEGIALKQEIFNDESNTSFESLDTDNTSTDTNHKNEACSVSANKESSDSSLSATSTQISILPEDTQLDAEKQKQDSKEHLSFNISEESNIIFVILIKLISWIYELPQWLQDTILSSTLVQSLIESVKYQTQFLEKKSNEFSLFSKDFSNIVNSGEDEINSSIYEKLSLLASPNSDHIDMSMTSNGSKVSFYILPTDIGSNIIADYNMLGLQHNFF